MRFGIKKADTRRAKAKGPKVEKATRAAVTMAARRDTEQFVPAVTHALRQSAHSQSDPQAGQLVYGDGGKVRYARPQYFSHPHKTLPGTVMRWFEHAKPRYLRTWLKEGEAAAKEAAGRG